MRKNTLEYQFIIQVLSSPTPDKDLKQAFLKTRRQEFQIKKKPLIFEDIQAELTLRFKRSSMTWNRQTNHLKYDIGSVKSNEYSMFN